MTAIKITTFDELESTNSYLKEHTGQFALWEVVRAVSQGSGRGRFERRWESVAGRDLTFSFRIPTESIAPEQIPCLTQVVAVAVAEVLESRGISLTIKWPNDILVDDKKICGILVEAVSIGSDVSIVTGIGLNVNSAERVIDGRPITSMTTATGCEYDLDTCIREIVSRVQAGVALLRITGFTPFADFINQRLAYRDQRRRFCDRNTQCFGTVKEVNADGTLSVQSDDGSLWCAQSGEITFSNNE